MTLFSRIIEKLKEETGVSLYLSFMMLTILLGLALGLSAILVSQLHILRGVGYSLISFYGAEAGIERVLYIDTKFCGGESSAQQRVLCINGKIAELLPSDFQLSNGAQYSLLVERTGQGTCPSSAPNYCARSTGVFQEANRAIRMMR